MGLHDVELIRIERAGLQNDGLGNGEHPDVVQHAAAAKRLHVVGIEIQPATERRGVVGHPVAMALGVSVARFDHRSERAQPFIHIEL